MSLGGRRGRRDIVSAVSFGKDASGNSIHPVTNALGSDSGTISAIRYRFADMPNHPDSQSPSSGETYKRKEQITTAPRYQGFAVA
jgi:hypothetical protein